jgi:hypothetical protein
MAEKRITVQGLMDLVNVPPALQYMASGLLMAKGIMLNDIIGVQIDRGAERLRVTLADEVLVDTTFAEIETGICDDGPGPAVDGGTPADPGGIPGA